MRKWVVALSIVVAASAGAQETPPLLSVPVVDALANELSGDRALETLKLISANHRTRGSRPFRNAADLIVARARAAGLKDAKVEEFPADGKIFYGTQRSRPPWDAELAELWEIGPNGKTLVTSWAKQPMAIAEDSEPGDVTTELVDVGAGAAESDYAGRNVCGKLILVSAQADEAQAIGVAKHGAAGIVSYAQNQHTGWWGENKDLVRWGHLDTFSPAKTFAFMISPAMAMRYKARIAKREHIMMRAVVRAGQHPGAYSVATAMIPGSDEKLSNEEIVFSCHLDHPNPGANDNASGCATILEVGVTLSKLIAQGRIPRPLRTIRFVWPPEVEGTMAILNAKPEWAKRIKAVVHMDMVGGGPLTKSVFHVSSGPGSLPSFVYDIGQAFGAWVNAETYKYAATGESKYPLVSAKGGKEPLLAQLDEYDMGSDHDVYQEASWRIPALYLHDWPDRYIHTTWDTPDKIDPTKLLRAAFIGAASGYFLASMTERDSAEVGRAMSDAGLRYLSRMNKLKSALNPDDVRALSAYSQFRSAEIDRSWRFFLNGPRTTGRMPFFFGLQAVKASGDSALAFARCPTPRGPMSVFGYDYLQDKIGVDRYSKLKLLKYQGLRGAGNDYAYEVLNLSFWGMRAIDIRNMVSAIYGPVPLDAVLEYLNALKDAGVVAKIAGPIYAHDRDELVTGEPYCK